MDWSVHFINNIYLYSDRHLLPDISPSTLCYLCLSISFYLHQLLSILTALSARSKISKGFLQPAFQRKYINVNFIYCLMAIGRPK